MRAHPTTRARACHSASRMYSLAMPSRARSSTCWTAESAHLCGSDSMGDEAAFCMDESCAATRSQRERTVGKHWKALERFRGLTRARGHMRSTTASRRRGHHFNNFSGGSMGQQDTRIQRDCGGVVKIRPPHRMPSDIAERITDVGSMRYAAQLSGMDDYEIADEIAISHGYMSKVLKGTAGLYGRGLVRFMRVTNSIAPLQWLGEQMGCDVIVRDARAAEIAALKAQLAAREAS